MNLVLALVSIEKIFRLTALPPNTSLSEGISHRNRVAIDRSLLDFLRSHFQNFSQHFSMPFQPDQQEGYPQFDGLIEDEQYDDITFLVVWKR